MTPHHRLVSIPWSLGLMRDEYESRLTLIPNRIIPNKPFPPGDFPHSRTAPQPWLIVALCTDWLYSPIESSPCSSLPRSPFPPLPDLSPTPNWLLNCVSARHVYCWTTTVVTYVHTSSPIVVDNTMKGLQLTFSFGASVSNSATPAFWKYCIKIGIK